MLPSADWMAIPDAPSSALARSAIECLFGTSAVWRPDPGRLAEAQYSRQLRRPPVKPVKAGLTGSQRHVANYILDGDSSTSLNTQPCHRHHMAPGVSCRTLYCVRGYPAWYDPPPVMDHSRVRLVDYNGL